MMLFERKTAKIPNSERGGMVLFYDWVFSKGSLIREVTSTVPSTLTVFLLFLVGSTEEISK